MLRTIRAHRSSVAPLLALGLVIATGGCSFRLVRPPPPREDWPERGNPHASEVNCTATPAPPLVDLTLFAGAGTIAFLERDSGTSTVALGLAIVSIPFLISAVYGTYHISHCRQYQSLF